MLRLHFSPFPVINTKRLSLRQITRTDIPALFQLRSDKKVMQYLDRPPVKTLGEAEDYFKKIQEMEILKQSITWAITLRDENNLIGTICHWNILPQHYRSEIGYSLLPAFQGKGIMQESIEMVLGYGFEKMGLHSVEAMVNPLNLASIRLLEKNSFRKEAYFRENYYFNGKFLDTAVYSLINPSEDSSRGALPVLP